MSEGFDEYDVVAGDPLEEADEEAADRKAQPFVDPDLDLCPVVPLGFTGAKVVFAMPEGELRFELASKIGTMLRTDIFACSAGQTFLTYWRDGEDKFLRDMCTVWFVRKCRQSGLWDTSRPIRSLGVWPGEDAGVVLHIGDEIWRLADRSKAEKLSIITALRTKGGPLYRLRPPAPRPGKKASAADGAWIREILDLWRFEAIGGEGLTGGDVVAGWLMAALLGAVAPFRGHLLVNAMAGGGKSTLVEFVHAVLSALAGDVVNSFSEAGIRNALSEMARPVLLDESEAGSGVNGPGVVEKTLELLRRMSTGTGGNRMMGDIGGGTVSQTAVGAVMLAAINPPKLGSADGTRIVEVRLLPLSGSDLAESVARPALATRADLEAAVAKAKALAPGMLTRALAGAWRYRADVDEMRAALTRDEQDPRTGDLIAMLASGRRLLLFDAPLTSEEADQEVAFWKPLLSQREAAEIVSNPGADCLAHLMAADAGLHVRDRRSSIGELINRWFRDREDYEDVLKAHGLRLFEGAGPDGRLGPWLLVANHHPRLEAIFRGTSWPDWRRTLGYLDGKGPEHRTWPAKKQRFGVGVEQRAIAIPLTPWFADRVVSRMAPGTVPLPRSVSVPPSVPEEVDEWPE